MSVVNLYLYIEYLLLVPIMQVSDGTLDYLDVNLNVRSRIH